MTTEKYAKSLAKEAKEIIFQMNILLQDIHWIEDKLKSLYEKILVDSSTDREKNMEQLNFLINKHRINVETREKIKTKNHELGIRINKLVGNNLWKDL